ncbi:MAG: ABC transporter ATP-binding protein [Flavobacteriaceae bacterium]|nr:ABC transporter ATP-binding protein [Flavobacteriaceae bacterium]
MVFCKNLHKYYGHLHVVKGIDLEISSGEIVAIIGESGAGKSTLLQLLGTLEKPNQGEIFIHNTAILELSANKLAAFRNKELGFVFQFHQLLPEFTALENAMMPGLIAKMGKQKAAFRAHELLDYLGLSDRIHHKPKQLSGGEQQRVAIARAQFNNPRVIFADEPTGNLDTQNAELIQEYFLKMRNDFGQTFVIVTHNMSLANIADRKLQMCDGNVTLSPSKS